MSVTSDDIAAADSRPDVVVVGSASRDVTAEDPRGWRLGGAVSYGSLTLARLGLRVTAIVGGDPDVAGSTEIAMLRASGVDVRMTSLRTSPVFENRQTEGARVQIALEPGEPIPVDAVPEAARDATAWLLAPVAGELADGWATVPPAQALVGLGWQGLLREIVAGRQVRRRAPRPAALLQRADVVGVSREDLPPGTLPSALLGLLRPGCALLVTDGSRGGARLMASEAPAEVAYTALPSQREVDPTGAGDVFLATYLADRLRTIGDRDTRALARAAAAASLAVEAPGLEGVPTAEAIDARLEQAAASPPSDQR